MHEHDHIEDMAKEAAGNHLEITNFAWRNEPEDSENWCVVRTKSRDSSILEESNAHVVDEEMKPYLGSDVMSMRFNHWGHGWFDGYAIRVYDDEGEITEAFAAYARLNLTDYPVLNSEDHSRREYEAQLKSIADNAPIFEEDPPEDWERKVFGWFWDNKQSALEYEGRPHVNEDEVKEALDALGIEYDKD